MFTLTQVSCSVLVANGSPIPVSTTGHALFPIKNPYRPLHLHNILITPHIIKNLICVRQFTRHIKCSIEFDEFGFTLKDYKTRQPLIRCDSNGPLYPVTSSAPQVFLSSSSSVWHQRLGHPGDHVLKYLISNKFISCNKEETSDICHSCHLGKHIRLPFVSFDSVFVMFFILLTPMFGLLLSLVIVVYVIMLYFLIILLIIFGYSHSNKNPMFMSNLFNSSPMSRHNLI